MPPGVLQDLQLEPGRRGLLGAARDGTALLVPGQRWQQGFQYVAETCELVAAQPYPHCDDPHPEKVPPANGPINTYMPPTLLGLDRCSSMQRDRDGVARARRHLAATRSHQLELELWSGTTAQAADPDHPNLWLSKAGVANDVTGAAPLDPEPALARLEQALADCLHGQRGMIHVRPELASRWAMGGGLRVEGQLLLTDLDTIVVVGSGYPGTAPNGGAAPDAGETWAYGTGPVFVLIDAVETLGTEAERVDRSENTITTIVEQQAAAIFSPCCVVAVNADLT